MKKKLNSILLVDDDEMTNFIHRKIVKKADVAEHIEIVLNGKEAIDYLTHSQPSLILLDINMPLMDGWEFLDAYKNLKNQSSKVIIVMLTTSLNPDDKTRADQISEISGFRTKPLTENMLNEIIEAYF